MRLIFLILTIFGLILINGCTKKKLEEIILVEIPSEIYPELRKAFIFVFENSGFREIKIDANIDFKKLYLSRRN